MSTIGWRAVGAPQAMIGIAAGTPQARVAEVGTEAGGGIALLKAIGADQAVAVGAWPAGRLGTAMAANADPSSWTW